MNAEERKAYFLERYYRIRRECIQILGGICVDCGAADSLEFDHADASTKACDVSKLMNGQRRERLLAELAKCVLRCHDCHVAKSTAQGDNNAVEHGSGLTGKKNCRCELCGPLKNAYMREWKANRKKSRGC